MWSTMRVGKETIASSIRCLKRRGTCVNYGGSSGLVETVSPLALAEAGSVFFHPSPPGTLYGPIRSRSRADVRTCLRRSVAVHCLLGSTGNLSFLRLQRAHARLESRGTLGKLLLTT